MARHGDLGCLSILGQLDQNNNAADRKVSKLLFLTCFMKDLTGGYFNGFQMWPQPVKLRGGESRQKLVFTGASLLKTCHPCPCLGWSVPTCWLVLRRLCPGTVLMMAPNLY